MLKRIAILLIMLIIMNGCADVAGSIIGSVLSGVKVTPNPDNKTTNTVDNNTIKINK